MSYKPLCTCTDHESILLQRKSGQWVMVVGNGYLDPEARHFPNLMPVKTYAVDFCPFTGDRLDQTPSAET